MFSRLEPGALLNKVLPSVTVYAYDQHLFVNNPPPRSRDHSSHSDLCSPCSLLISRCSAAQCSMKSFHPLTYVQAPLAILALSAICPLCSRHFFQGPAQSEFWSHSLQVGDYSTSVMVGLCSPGPFPSWAISCQISGAPELCTLIDCFLLIIQGDLCCIKYVIYV